MNFGACMSRKVEQSRKLQKRAEAVIPGGVNSPVRAFRAVGGNPPFIERGEGAYLYDIDGNRYLDCVGSWGPLLFGHANPRVREAIIRQTERGFTYGAPTELEIELAEAVCRCV